MSWTDDEWDAVASLLEQGWQFSFEFDEKKALAYRFLLADIDPARVLIALRTIVQRGGERRPSAAEIVAVATSDPGRPTFDEAFAALFQGVHRRRPFLSASTEAAALAAADELHPYVGAFLRAQGFDRLRMLQVNDPDYGALRRRELADAYDRHVEVCDERVRTDRSLQAAGRNARQIGPRRLDPRGLLGLDRVGELTAGGAA